MKRSLLTALGITALVFAAPAAALARGGHGHHHKHHKGMRLARRHGHAAFHLVHLGATTSTAGAGTGTATGPTAPTTPPSGTTPSPESAGTVASYTNGLLTLTLTDGSTVSGKVTNATRIECVKATTAPSSQEPESGAQSGDDGPGDDRGEGDDQSRGDMSQNGGHESDEISGESQGGDDGLEVQGPVEAPCDSSALVAGVVVRSAELRVGPSGSEFESIVLVR